jgi:4-amino-4-deoxychorismate lyase
MPVEGALRDRLGASERLIETMRHEPDTGFVRSDLHLARLRNSATALGFRFDAPAIDFALEQAVASADDMQRIRLTIGRDGDAEVTTQPFVPLTADATWTLRLAATRLHSDDGLLAHKTTRRDVYEQARAEFPRTEADEVLLSNEREELCEGTITNLFVDRGDGLFLTPPRRAGLLPGVLRGALLAAGRAIESTLTRDDLIGTRIFIGNSLRGLIPTRFLA